MFGSSWWDANVDNEGFCVIISPGQQPAGEMVPLKRYQGPKHRPRGATKACLTSQPLCPVETHPQPSLLGNPFPSLKQPCHPGELRHPFIRGFASSSQKTDTPSLQVGFRGHSPVTTTQAWCVGTGISRASCCRHRWEQSYLGSADDSDLDHRMGGARSPSLVDKTP